MPFWVSHPRPWEGERFFVSCLTVVRRQWRWAGVLVPIGPKFRHMPCLRRRWTLALTLLPVRLRHPLPRYIRARHYGMCHVSLLRRTNIQLPPSSSRPQKFSYKLSSRGLKYLERHYWRPLDRLQKVWLHLGVHVISTKGTLVLQMQNTDHRVRLAPRSRGLATRRQVL